MVLMRKQFELSQGGSVPDHAAQSPNEPTAIGTGLSGGRNYSRCNKLELVGVVWS
jgi:hypothetical protein